MLLPDLSNSITGARNLLGWELVHHTPAGDIGGIIIETEAYSQDDEASHSYRGKTARTAPMFEGAGYIYMYFIYGMHWCMNIVTGPKGHGEAVLIRALQPTRGEELMEQYRKVSNHSRFTNGPGSLVQALAIPPTYSGLHISKTDLELIPPNEQPTDIKIGPRIGIKKAVDKPWRFYIDCPGCKIFSSAPNLFNIPSCVGKTLFGSTCLMNSIASPIFIHGAAAGTAKISTGLSGSVNESPG